jgi:hypothetical protein
MSIATQLAPVWFFPAAGAGLLLGATLNSALKSPTSDPREQVFPHVRTVEVGAGLLGAGCFSYAGLNTLPGIVRRFHVDSAERISAHMIERNWPGRGAVAGAVLAGLGVGALYTATSDDG